MKSTNTNTTRRKFIGGLTSAIAFPTIIPSSALGKDGAVAPSERVTMGIIGYGTITQKTIGNFFKDKRVQITSVADPEKRGKFYGYNGEMEGGREIGKEQVDAHYENTDCKMFGDFRELINQGDMDSVYIATPDHWHAYMAVAAAKAGKHIYGQKPLALNIDQGRKMVTAIEKAGVTWSTGSQQRSDAYFWRASEYVRNGRLGKLTKVKVGIPYCKPRQNWSKQGHLQEPTNVPEGLDWNMWQGPAPSREYCPALHPLNWRHNYDYSGGMLTDFGAHHIDIAHWALGMDKSGPVLISNGKADMPNFDVLYNTPDEFSFDSTYENGLVMEVSSTHRQGITFEGENGKSIYVDRNNHEYNPIDILKEKITDTDTRLYKSTNHYANFIDCIHSGEKTAAPIEASHRSIAVAHLANIMFRTGSEKLEWDPQTEQIKDNPEATKLLSSETKAEWTV